MQDTSQPYLLKNKTLSLVYNPISASPLKGQVPLKHNFIKQLNLDNYSELLASKGRLSLTY
jgi:hypothetical protein